MPEDNERKLVVEHLADALDAEKSTEKHFHVREALQLLNTGEG